MGQHRRVIQRIYQPLVKNSQSAFHQKPLDASQTQGSGLVMSSLWDGSDSGHTFLAFEEPRIGRWGIGFYPTKGWRGSKGWLNLSDGNHPYNYKKTYWACPESMKAVKERIYEDGEKTTDKDSPIPKYDIFDVKDDNDSYHCTTWACEVLRDAGNTDPGLRRSIFTEPYDLARIPGMSYNTSYR